MFSHPDDPESVIEARRFELEQVAKWISAARLEKPAASWGDEL
jgi:hypothetical protein